MTKCNSEIRKRAIEKGIYLWQIAERYGIAEWSFSRKLRRELSDDEKAKIFQIIDELAKEV